MVSKAQALLNIVHSINNESSEGGCEDCDCASDEATDNTCECSCHETSEGIEIDWQEDNIGGFKADVETAYAQYTVHADEKGWIVARAGKVFGSGKVVGLKAAQAAVAKFLGQLQTRGQ